MMICHILAAVLALCCTALGYVTGNIAEAETLYEYIDMLLNN